MSITIRERLASFWERSFRTCDEPYPWIDAEAVEEDKDQQIKYLRLQLMKIRAENTVLQSRTDDWRVQFSKLFTMSESQLQELARHYDIWEADSAPGWFVAANNCVFCGCGLEVTAFHTRRDALLYAALLQTMGYHPRHNLCCSSCYAECI